MKKQLYIMATLVSCMGYSNIVLANAPPGHCTVLTGSNTRTASLVNVSNADPIGTVYPLNVTLAAGSLFGSQCTPRASGAGIHARMTVTSDYKIVLPHLGNGQYDVGIPGLALVPVSADNIKYTNPSLGTETFYPYVMTGSNANLTFHGRNMPSSYSLVRVNGNIPAGNNSRTVNVFTADAINASYMTLPDGNTHTLGNRFIGTDRLVINFQQTASTCSFQSDRVSFPLGDVNASIFSGVGSYSHWTISSLISSGCQNVSEVGMTFQAPADSDNGALFAAQGGASGVGIELQSTTQLPAVPDNTTKMLWSPRASGAGYEFRARYVQTRSNITPGNANANIIVNMHYQ